MQDFAPIQLFDRINIQSSHDFENFLNELNSDQATFVIQIALEKAYNSGIFNLSEAEILSKSLRIKNNISKSTPKDESKRNK
jgi:hypothetical protein